MRAISRRMGVDRKAVEVAFGVVGVCALLGVSRSGCYKFGFNEGRQALWSGGGNGRGSRSAGSMPSAAGWTGHRGSLRACAPSRSRRSLGSCGLRASRVSARGADALDQTPSNPRTPNHHRSQPDRSTDAHQTGPTPPGLAQLVALDVSQSGRPGRRLPLAVNDCSHRLGTDGVDRRTEHESEGLDMAYEQLPIVDVDLDGLLLDLENY